MQRRLPPIEEIPRLDPDRVGRTAWGGRRPDGTPEPTPRYQRFFLAISNWYTRRFVWR